MFLKIRLKWRLHWCKKVTENKIFNSQLNLLVCTLMHKKGMNSHLPMFILSTKYLIRFKEYEFKSYSLFLIFGVKNKVKEIFFRNEHLTKLQLWNSNFLFTLFCFIASVGYGLTIKSCYLFIWWNLDRIQSL